MRRAADAAWISASAVIAALAVFAAALTRTEKDQLKNLQAKQAAVQQTNKETVLEPVADPTRNGGDKGQGGPGIPYSALVRGDIVAVTEALENGRRSAAAVAEVEPGEPRTGQTALMIASHLGYLEMVDLLLSYGAVFTIDARLSDTGDKKVVGLTALHLCLDGWHQVHKRRVVALAVPAGVPLPMPGVSIDHPAVLRALLAAGAGPMVGVDSGRSAIEFAYYSGMHPAIPGLLAAASCSQLEPFLTGKSPAPAVFEYFVSSDKSFALLCRTLFIKHRPQGTLLPKGEYLVDDTGWFDAAETQKNWTWWLEIALNPERLNECTFDSIGRAVDQAISRGIALLSESYMRCNIAPHQMLMKATTPAKPSYTYRAVMSGDVRSALELRRMGDDMLTPGPFGRTGLHAGVLNLDPEIVADMLSPVTGELSSVPARLLAVRDVLGNTAEDYARTIARHGWTGGAEIFCLVTDTANTSRHTPKQRRERCEESIHLAPPSAASPGNERAIRKVASPAELTKGIFGWREYPREAGVPPLLEDIGPERCDFVVVEGGNPSSEELFNASRAWSMPTIVRGLARTWGASYNWGVDGLKEQVGELKVQVGPLPYARTLGVNGHKMMRVADFVDQMLKSEPGPGSPYVFDDQLFRHAGPKFQQEAFPAGQPPFETWRPEIGQFMLGPAGSGAPMHEHKHAINALFFGRKRWAVLPPGAKKWSNEVAHDWFRTPGALDGTLQCVQGPGDVLILPPCWAHAVLNVEDVVASAIEVIPGYGHFDFGSHWDGIPVRMQRGQLEARHKQDWRSAAGAAPSASDTAQAKDEL